MCPEVPEEDYDRGKITRDAWLLKYLSVLKQSLKWLFLLTLYPFMDSLFISLLTGFSHEFRGTDFQFDKGDLENVTLSLLRQGKL